MNGHFKFDTSLLSVVKRRLQRASVAAGGSIVCIDSTGMKYRMKMSKRACNAFGDMYFKNGTDIISIEYAGVGITFITSNVLTDDIIINNVEQFKSIIDEDVDDWYYDGKLVYSLNVMDDPKQLSQHSYIEHVRIPTYNLNILTSSSVASHSYHSGLRMFGVVTFPLWSDVQTSIVKHRPSSMSTDTQFLDMIDHKKVVNLNGLLKLCEVSSKHFGAETIECFELVQYMKLYRTVNLPKLSKRVRTTAPTGLSYTDMLCFVMGKIKRCKTQKEISDLKVVCDIVFSHNLVQTDVFDDNKIYTTQDFLVPELKSYK